MISPKDAYRLRSQLYQGIRDFFHQRDYQEVYTPSAVVSPGTEVYLDYFSTHWKDMRGTEHPLYLRSSPELHMKQVMGLGLPRIFQIATCWRNGGELSYWHHPEFTMLEWYEAGISFLDYVDQTISLLRELHGRVGSGDDGIAFTKLTLAEAFQRWAQLELVDGDPDLAIKARAKGIISVLETDDFETAFFKILIERIEPELKSLRRVVLWDYPPSQAALAQVQHGAAKRFEIYWDGVELCNGFWELTDADANRLRVRESNAKRIELGKSAVPEDLEFFGCLEKGIPECCGNALGLDRVLALFCGLNHLDPILPLSRQFPFEIPQF